ncbi:hypothetical protein D9613_012668 [Agrocybe pediades]|uniref:Uncharacterized protein n=1 Tax=Agrocybe pediades TaxID=84607 RepID=A0A8H4VQ92_9AGAR|nr:hypothetical protein D9613_012668 [Agrocybe pediades]
MALHGLSVAQVALDVHGSYLRELAETEYEQCHTSIIAPLRRLASSKSVSVALWQDQAFADLRRPLGHRTAGMGDVIENGGSIRTIWLDSECLWAPSSPVQWIWHEHNQDHSSTWPLHGLGGAFVSHVSDFTLLVGFVAYPLRKPHFDVRPPSHHTRRSNYQLDRPLSPFQSVMPIPTSTRAVRTCSLSTATSRARVGSYRFYYRMQLHYCTKKPHSKRTRKTQKGWVVSGIGGTLAGAFGELFHTVLGGRMRGLPPFPPLRKTWPGIGRAWFGDLDDDNEGTWFTLIRRRG